jgi:hypothetical protein
LKLDERSHKLLAASSDALLLGVVVNERTIALFRAGGSINRRRRTFPGHQALIDEGVIKPPFVRGFSLDLRGRKVRRFYRNSILNAAVPLCCISHDEMNSILDACELTVAEDFECYP